MRKDVESEAVESEESVMESVSSVVESVSSVMESEDWSEGRICCVSEEVLVV